MGSEMCIRDRGSSWSACADACLWKSLRWVWRLPPDLRVMTPTSSIEPISRADVFARGFVDALGWQKPVVSLLWMASLVASRALGWLRGTAPRRGPAR